MEIITELYRGEAIRLAPIDHDKDPEVMARWTHDPVYAHGASREPMRPQSAAAIRKKLEKIEKQIDEKRTMFFATIRPLGDDRLLGACQISHIELQHGSGVAGVAIGDAADRRKGYGSDALRLLLQIAFQEFNLCRVTAWTDAYNPAATRLFSKFGFVEEVRRKQALFYDGQRWDAIHMGILREEWESRK